MKQVEEQQSANRGHDGCGGSGAAFCRSKIGLRTSASGGVAALALMVVFVANNGGASVVQSDATGRAVEAEIRNEMRTRHIPGAQVAVVRHGHIVFSEAFGIANVEYAVPVTKQTVFTINSATKAFTAVALMQLVEAGKLDLDAPISRYLDELPESWRAITVLQLASHTSGLPDLIDPVSGKLRANGDPAAAWAEVQTLSLEFARGEKERYNQTNYFLLGKLIDKLSGEHFTQFITEKQLNVVKMPRTVQSGWGDDRSVVLSKARPYTRQLDTKDKPPSTNGLYNAHYEIPEILYTASGMHSTADEIARWIIALQQGRILKKSSLRTLLTHTTLNDGSPGHWGVGWPIDDRPGHRVANPSGGARSVFAIYSDDDLAVVILTNLVGANPEAFEDNIACIYMTTARTSEGCALHVPRVGSL